MLLLDTAGYKDSVEGLAQLFRYLVFIARSREAPDRSWYLTYFRSFSHDP